MKFLHQMGWGPFFSQSLDIQELTDFLPARIIREDKSHYRVVAETGERQAALSGHLRRAAAESGDWPAVGDWVLVDPAAEGDQTVIRRTLPRKSLLARGRVDSNRLPTSGIQSQVLAANVDLAFIVEAMGEAVNLNRIERYLALVHDLDIQPVVLLSKADVIEDVIDKAAAVNKRLPDVETVAVSARTGLGLDQALAYLEVGRTGVLLGPSGVGKSTLINRFLDSEVQAVGLVREIDGKGRHTTTARQLFMLPQGGLIIDTPGLRAVGLTGESAGLQTAFKEIDQWAARCRYRDCRHEAEPGCAVRQAVEEGRLDRSRFEHFLTLRKEAEQALARTDPEALKRAGRRMSRMQAEVKRLEKRRFER
ncbi:MAG: ribosome small subunit-dependent GTPase A [Pseudomonadota bacterium]